MTTPPLCIVGVGARTSIGLTAPSSAAAARAAISGIREHPRWIDKAGQAVALAMDRDLDDDLAGESRCVALGASALAEALTPLAGKNRLVGPVSILLGLPELRPGISERWLSEAVSDLLGTSRIDMPLAPVPTTARGHSAGIELLLQAIQLVKADRSTVVVVGGIDSYCDRDGIRWLDRNDRLMSAENRSGFPPGEAAAFCLVLDQSMAERLGLRVLATVHSAAMANEDNGIATRTICTGVGLAQAIMSATEDLASRGERVDRIVSDLNGERYRTEEWVFAGLRARSRFENVHAVQHPADCWGDVGAASCPLFMALAVAPVQRGYASGSNVLLWASADGGRRGAAVLRPRCEAK